MNFVAGFFFCVDLATEEEEGAGQAIWEGEAESVSSDRSRTSFRNRSSSSESALMSNRSIAFEM